MEFQFSLHLGATSGEGKFGDRKILQKDKERGQRSRHLLTFKNFRTWRCLSVIPKKNIILWGEILSDPVKWENPGG